MPRRNKWKHLMAGVVAGVMLGIYLRTSLRASIEACPESAQHYVAPDPLAVIGIKPYETVHNSNRTLVFVGVMTAEQYLDTRAKAVFNTWAQDLPGRLAFFSSEVSRAPGLPLIPLPTVDDIYPPQRKVFLMLLYMYENYGERFEWFMRADDDVYVRGDKLGEFLRSVDSRKPRFIGQMGKGTKADRDALALGYNENFCMGGPGVLISREMLRRVAPHLMYCLKHVYTMQEDVELGRCVTKFTGVSCTWSYDYSPDRNVNRCVRESERESSERSALCADRPSYRCLSFVLSLSETDGPVARRAACEEADTRSPMSTPDKKGIKRQFLECAHVDAG
ncbi:chondroitin sulfate synthase 1-like [Epargyreus clarus]|uniref:chondroitin sulfate synthase 1-like n=1 Tax=Epargyreus clarus TaxID=520877 RepID=UPI003C2AFD0F